MHPDELFADNSSSLVEKKEWGNVNPTHSKHLFKHSKHSKLVA